MSGRREAEDTAVPLAVLMHIEAICDRFEAAWRSDGRPDLAAFMADGPGPDQAQDRLLHGLLTLDLEFRIGRGESPDPQAYLEQFPEYSTAIREVFADFGRGQGQAPPPEHRNRIQGPGTLAASPGADTQFGEACRGPSSVPPRSRPYGRPATRSTASSAGEAWAWFTWRGSWR